MPNLDRLRLALTKMEEVKRDGGNFSFSTWWRLTSQCGCVVGWCMRDTRFIEQGLRQWSAPLPLPYVTIDPPLTPAAAVKQFFGVDDNQYWWLFLPQKYESWAPDTVDEAIRRLTLFIAKHEEDEKHAFIRAVLEPVEFVEVPQVYAVEPV